MVSVWGEFIYKWGDTGGQPYLFGGCYPGLIGGCNSGLIVGDAIPRYN